MRVLVEYYIIVRAFIVSDPEISKPANHRFELGPMLVKEFLVGKRETHLGLSPNDVSWQIGFHCLPQNILGPAILE